MVKRPVIFDLPLSWHPAFGNSAGFVSIRTDADRSRTETEFVEMGNKREYEPDSFVFNASSLRE